MLHFIANNIFPAVLNMSLTAAVVIVFVLVARLLLRRAPKIFSYALWAVVLFRLLCPVALTANFSLLNVVDAGSTPRGEFTSSTNYLSEGMAALQTQMDAVQNFDELAGLAAPQPMTPPQESVGKPVELLPGFEETVVPLVPAESEKEVVSPMTIASALWLGGIAALGVYSVGSLLLLRRRLVGSVLLEGNVYLADNIETPFVLGLFRPRIYLPSTLSGRERSYIIRHEQHHIHRGDHIFKAIGFAALCLHWFNPLVWVAFVFAGKDMEMSCDEAVVSSLGEEIRADYSASLLALATPRRMIAPSPLAFGEGDPKERIKNMLRWKKPKLWITVAAAIACVVLIALCGTNPRNEELPADSSRGEYADVAAYVESLMAAQETATFYVDPATPESGNVVITLVEGQEVREKTTAVIDRRLEILTKTGELAGLAPEGTLEAWQYRYLLKLDDAAGIMLVGGMLEVDGYYDLEGQGGHNVVALRYDDGSYDILYDAPINDNMNFRGYCESYAEVLHDWYVKKHNLDRPLYVEDWAERVDYPDESYGGNFPVHRFDGEGWYLYIPVQAWSQPLKNDAGNFEIHSQYNTGSSIIVGRSELDSETVLQGYLDNGYQMTEFAAVKDDGVEVDSVFVYDAPDGGSYVLHAIWYHENINDYDPIAIEPQVLRLMAESFTVDESIYGEALKPLPEYLAALDGENIHVGWDVTNGKSPDGTEVAALIRGAMGNILSNTGMLTMNGTATDIIWSLELYVGVGKTGWSGDEMLHLYAGQTNNVVEILSGLHPAGANRVVVNDAALYEFVRTSMDDPAAERIDAEPLARYRELVDLHLADVPHYGEGVTVERELISFYPVDEKKEIGAVIYCMDSVLNVTPREKAPYLLAGGAYVDSELRVHGIGAPELLVTVDGQAVGYTNWEWLEFDGGLESVSTVAELLNIVAPLASRYPQLSYVDLMKVEPKGQGTFADLLGCSGYISTEEGAAGWKLRSYYADTVNGPQLMAESFGYTHEDYAMDFNGDGVRELITNNTYGADGVRQTYVYRREGAIIYFGELSAEGFADFNDWGAGASWSEFDPREEVFRLHYSTKNNTMATVEYKDIDAFRFAKFVDLAPPVVADTAAGALGELSRYMVFDSLGVEFYRVDGSSYRPLVVNGELLDLLAAAGRKTKTIDSREHIASRGGGIFIELGDNDERHISLFAAEEADTVLVRYVGNSINEVALVSDPRLYMYILATEETPGAEVYDIDEDGESEVLLQPLGTNVKNLVIYDHVAGKTLRTDVNEELGCKASDYTGNIGNIKGEYANMVREIRADGSVHVQRYDNGEFTYMVPLAQALRE